MCRKEVCVWVETSTELRRCPQEDYPKEGNVSRTALAKLNYGMILVGDAAYWHKAELIINHLQGHELVSDVFQDVTVVQQNIFQIGHRHVPQNVKSD